MKPFWTTTMENRVYTRDEGSATSVAAQETRLSTRVICNPSSGGGSCVPYRLREQLSRFEIDWVETSGPGDALAAAEEWDAGLLVVAGGDGTVNEVVNGLGKSGFPEAVTLALLPAGTDNDLAATLAIPEDAGEAEAVIRQGRVRALDVARVRSEGAAEERYFLNVATGGLGAKIFRANDEELKSRWGKLSYLRASLAVVRSFGARKVKLALDGEKRAVHTVNIVVGNCRYAGGGWLAAPRANPEDGFLDIVVVEKPGVREALALAPAALFGSDYLERRGVLFARARVVHVGTIPPGLEFTVDGEFVGDEPVEFAVLSRALQVVVGPGYQMENSSTGGLRGG